MKEICYFSMQMQWSFCRTKLKHVITYDTNIEKRAFEVTNVTEPLAVSTMSQIPFLDM